MKYSVPYVVSVAVLFSFLYGCASPISKEVRKEAKEDLEFIRVLENPKSFRGTVVIWGGVIMKAVSRPGGSELYLWETPLDLRGRPKGREFAEGEYIAETSHFLDPKIYAEGQKITVAGEITGEKLGEYDNAPYVYPVLKIRESHLWGKESPSIGWFWGETPYYWPDRFDPDKQHRRPLP